MLAWSLAGGVTCLFLSRVLLCFGKLCCACYCTVGLFLLRTEAACEDYETIGEGHLYLCSDESKNDEWNNLDFNGSIWRSVLLKKAMPSNAPSRQVEAQQTFFLAMRSVGRGSGHDPAAPCVTVLLRFYCSSYFEDI